jgi:hypothetical protein
MMAAFIYSFSSSSALPPPPPSVMPTVDFVGMDPNTVDFTAEASFDDIADLKKLIIANNPGRKVLDIKLLPWMNQVRFALVRDKEPKPVMQRSHLGFYEKAW